MQAPTTTQGGPAERDPQARACPSCGAANTTAAAFCWQCYLVFGPSAATSRAPVTPSTWPLAPAPPGPFVAARQRSRLGLLAWVVAITLGVVVAVVFVAARKDGVSFPETFAGLQRAADGGSEAAAASFRAASETEGLDADMAFYGEGAMPVVALAYIRWPDGTSGEPEEAYDAFSEGFMSGYNGSVLATDRLESTVDGVNYLCASVGGAVGAGLCMWQDEDVFWVLMDVRPGGTIAGTKRLAVTAHDATA